MSVQPEGDLEVARQSIEVLFTSVADRERMSASDFILPGPVTREGFKELLPLRYQPAHAFTDLLMWAINFLRNHPEAERWQPIIDALTRNYEEENGISQRDYGPAHIIPRRVAMQAVGIDSTAFEHQLGSGLTDLSGYHPAARLLISAHLELGAMHPLAIATLLAYWEGRIPRLDYPAQLQRLGELYGFKFEPDRVLTRSMAPEEILPADHIGTHIGHDPMHEKDIVDAVLACIQSVEDCEIVRMALEAAQSIWNIFWNMINIHFLKDERGV